ncbi:Hypothetical protein P9215_16431 [Prochlorococcus marinus str. MIT 9215]|uniref:Uncharacterized protein n=1 Tax=Prochlorococcus marinus (strain MIT 9215) TaxID=93060 RepID=A8G6M5_PROM2|nr:hypothetical protein [Prochlorococcus marinus]ABV51256.1 Hypothetical protein P9215_16431 [Prochlorococcus marinus str. MIT 9215]
MEVLLFALFFISALIFFIAGKDDFGRTESKLTIKEEESVKDEKKEELKVAEKGDIEPQQETVKEEKKEELKVAEKEDIEPQQETVKEEKKEELKVAEKEDIEPQQEIKKDS